MSYSIPFGQPTVSIILSGEDNNVPVWHTCEQVGIIKTWDPDADVTCVLLFHSSGVNYVISPLY